MRVEGEGLVVLRACTAWIAGSKMSWHGFQDCSEEANMKDLGLANPQSMIPSCKSPKNPEPRIFLDLQALPSLCTSQEAGLDTRKVQLQRFRVYGVSENKGPVIYTPPNSKIPL